MSRSFHGLWSLQSWHKVWDDNRLQLYTEQPVGGYLYYSPEGQMAVSVYEQNTSRLLTAYAGAYEFLGDQVIHYPREGLSPAGPLVKKIRYLELINKQMTLRSPWMEESSGRYQHRLIWLKKDS